MCQICEDYVSNKISGEAAIDQMKMIISAAKPGRSLMLARGHAFELTEIILAREVPMAESNPELDKAWSEKNEQDKKLWWDKTND